MDKQSNKLKIIILVQAFIIVGLVGNIMINRDAKAITTTIPVESNSEIKVDLPEIVTPQQPEVEDEEKAEEEAELPPTQEPTNENSDNSNFDLALLADEQGFIIDDGVLVKYLAYNTTVIIPDTVTTIGKGAFEDCHGIDNVTIPNSVTRIEDRAFYNCGMLMYITHSSEVTFVGEEVFVETPWFENLNQEYNIIGDGILIKYNMRNSNSITLPNTIKSIASNAFEDCTSLQSLTLSSSVNSIGDNAFATCWSLEEINLNLSLQHIGDYAFNDTPWYYNLEDDFVVLGDGVLIKYNGIYNNVQLPSNVKAISAGVFENFNSIDRVTLPDTMTYIGEKAFAGCMSLEYLNLPNVTYIGDDAFEETMWFENLSDEFCVVGDNILIKYNGNNANVVIPDGVKAIAKDTFSTANSMITLSVPNSVTNFDINALNYNYHIYDISYSNDVIRQEIINKYMLTNEAVMRQALEQAQQNYVVNGFSGRVEYKIYLLSLERGCSNIYVMPIDMEGNQEGHEWKPNLVKGYELVITDEQGFFVQLIR